MHKTSAIISACFIAGLLLPTIAVEADSPLTADGTTQTLTPGGAFITPPPGAPLLIILEDPANVTPAPDSFGWGPIDLSQPQDGRVNADQSGTGASPSAVASCNKYVTGWYETNSASLYGGHTGIIPQNMPPSMGGYCSGSGMGYTDAVSFGTNSWIQAGLAIFPGETRAKWFCQSNDNGVLNTQYGSANAYANGATVFTWFSRDSGGVWRTYRYDTGPFSVQLPCSITRGASGNLQTFGEVQLASSTSAQMGVWNMFDLRYQTTAGLWLVPTQMQAMYPYSTPCPPYGAGTITAGIITAGSGQACTTGTRTYPN